MSGEEPVTRRLIVPTAVPSKPAYPDAGEDGAASDASDLSDDLNEEDYDAIAAQAELGRYPYRCRPGSRAGSLGREWWAFNL